LSFCLVWASDHYPPTSASCIAEVTDTLSL
jgi:hypothetical protein